MPLPMFWLGLVCFLITMAFSFFLAPFFIRAAFHYKLLDIPTERKAHGKPVPYVGGLVLFITFWLVIGVGMLVLIFGNGSFQAGSRLPAFFSHTQYWFREIRAVFFGSLIVLIVGLIDDRYDLNPLVKFMGQCIAAFILLGIGLKVNLVQELGWIGYGVTFVWIVLLINAFNFIDSIDGHCLGIVIISCLIFFSLTLIAEQAVVGLFVLIFLGALLGFFPYNFKPARAFLGDNGSLFLGYIMSVITLLCRYNGGPNSKITPLIPILMFGVPIYDTVSVVVVRVFRGIVPWKGDRNHFAHRLVKLGMGEMAAAVSSYFIALTLGLVALLSTQVTTLLGNFLIALIFISVITIIAILEYYASSRIHMMEQISEIKQRHNSSSNPT